MTFEVHTNTDPNVIRVFIVRHGQTDHNIVKILQGHQDIDINQTGLEQAQKVGQYLSTIPFDYFISSDLVRCTKTTHAILQHHPHIPLSTTVNLRERNMGKVEGMYLKDAIAQYGPDFRNLGEDYTALVARVGKEWDILIKQSIENNYTNAGLCTHGGVITGFINYLYGVKKYDLGDGLTPDKLKVPFNTSVTIIDVNKQTGHGIIQRFGLTSHLGGDFEVKDQLLR